jgi:hypothetical protein
MKVIKFQPGLIPVLKHEEHDQKTHGSWAGVSGLATLGKELLTPAQIKAFDNEIKKVPESHIEALRASGTKVRIMDSPKVMSPDEAPHFNRGDNEIRLDKNSGASALLHEIGHALDFNAKSGNGFLSDDPNFRKIIKDSKFPDFSNQRNTFARNEEFAVAYENYYTDGGKFIGASPTKEFKQVMEGIGTYILSEKVQKHQEHDQSSHGNWAEGSQGSVAELSNNEISNIISGSTTVNEMYQKVAERLGKSMKPKLEDLSEEEINFFRGVTDVDRDAQRLLDGRIPFTPFQTWGQGIYISSEPEYAQAYGDLIRLKLDKSVKLVEGEIAWTKAYSLFDKETSLDMPKILDRITSGKMDNFSDSDIANIYWAAKGYDGYSVYRYGRAEVVLFNADKLTVNRADIGEAVQKHLMGQHDQKTHGRWAGSGLPHELEDVKGSLQKYFDGGLITKLGEQTRPKRDYKAREDGTGYDYITTRVPFQDTLDQPFMTFRAPYDYDDPEGAQIFKDFEEKMLGGNYEEIEALARQEALDAGMGSRQALYYGQAIASRASLYVTMHNEALRQEAAEIVYSRDFGTYQEKGGSREYFEQRAKTMKTLSENISKASPVVAIETEDFLGVIKDGRFKTQHETRESNGAYKPALRKEAELAIAGVPLDTKSSERPVYGYLAVQNDGETSNTSPYNTDKWNVNNTGVGQYGEVRVVLKDEVRDRTSYTIPDSLDRNAIPQPLSRNGKADLINAGAYYDLSTSHAGFQRESYAEAQVYGGVKLSDIKAVYVVPSKSFDDNTYEYTPRDHVAQADSIRTALSAKGFDIPVEVLPLPKKGG